jgi:hypothetical protein
MEVINVRSPGVHLQGGHSLYVLIHMDVPVDICRLLGLDPWPGPGPGLCPVLSEVWSFRVSLEFGAP